MSNKYKIGDVVDLDDVAISPRAYAHWQLTAEVSARALAVNARGELVIPDEQRLWLASGELEIFVEAVVGQTPHRISMKIPAGEWRWM